MPIDWLAVTGIAAIISIAAIGVTALATHQDGVLLGSILAAIVTITQIAILRRVGAIAG